MASSGTESMYLLVSHIEDDGCTFWAQQHTPTMLIDLDSINTQLETLASKKSTSDGVKDVVKDRVYACQYTDENWYRCRVLFPIGKDKCLVQFIDYGNCQENSNSSLVTIPFDLQERNIAAMAHRYRLANVQIKHEMSEIARQYLESICSDDFLKAEEVVDTKEPQPPKKVILYDGQGANVAEQLIKLGIAVELLEVKPKANVVLSSPPIPQAQLFRNPLLSSPDSNEAYKLSNSHGKKDFKKGSRPTTDISSNIESSMNSDVNYVPDKQSGAAKNVQQCSNCEVLRLSLMKLTHDIKDSENKVAESMIKEEYWKKKFFELQHPISSDATKTDIPSIGISDAKETSPATEKCQANEGIINDVESNYETPSQQPKNVSSVPCKSVEYDNEDKEESLALVVNEHDSKYHDAPYSSETAEKCQSKANFSENETKQCSPRDSFHFMKKIVIPAFECCKEIMRSNNIVVDTTRYEEDLTAVVAKIKACIETGGSQNDANYLAFIAKRNATLENLKPSLQQAIKLLSRDCESKKEAIDNHLALLKTIPGYNDTDTVHEVSVAAVEEEMKMVAKDGSISKLSGMLAACLTQQWNRFNLSKNLLGHFKDVLSDLSSFKDQETIIKETYDEIRAIRKRKQAIRLLATQLRNLEEEKEVASSSEIGNLNLQIKKVTDELSSLRLAIQESLENNWRLMESIADMVEKFSPELQLEYPLLGVTQFIEGKGIIMKEMEFDHFDIHEKEYIEYLKADVFTTKYRGDKIFLHKYTVKLAGHEFYEDIMNKVAIYSNIESQNVILPIGIFVDKSAAYVMVSAPRVEVDQLTSAASYDIDTILTILRDIAEALFSLHENGITHGMLSANCIFLSVNPNLQAFLSVPSFFSHQGIQSQTLAKDILQYGKLAETLLQGKDNEKVRSIVTNCLQNSTAITMKEVLDCF